MGQRQVSCGLDPSVTPLPQGSVANDQKREIHFTVNNHEIEETD
jgi:hypothetical protein